MRVCEGGVEPASGTALLVALAVDELQELLEDLLVLGLSHDGCVPDEEVVVVVGSGVLEGLGQPLVLEDGQQFA